MKYAIHILIVLLCLNTHANAQGIENNVFDRARSVVGIVKTMRPDMVGNTARARLSDKVSPQATAKSTQSSHFELAIRPETKQKLATLPACEKSEKYKRDIAHVSSVFQSAEYIFFSAANEQEGFAVVEEHPEAVPFFRSVQTFEGAKPDLRLELSRELPLRCFPTRVTVKKKHKGYRVTFEEGKKAWGSGGSSFGFGGALSSF